MDAAHIAELLQPFLSPISNRCHSESDQRSGEEPAVLSASQLQDISTYIDILLRWNARINLTAIRDPEEIVTRHFGESLFAARHLFPQVYPVPGACPERSRRVSPVVKAFDSSGSRVADLGSGAGFPGIPMKLWAPHLSITLIESNHKKATFLREVVRSLTLTGINIQTVRAEDVTQAFDVVTLRAVERFADALPIAARLLAPHSRLALLIAQPQVPTAISILPQLSWHPPIPVPQSKSRVFLVGVAP
jgi:16S rRNA (guanine527-N7)-methyltransferase